MVELTGVARANYLVHEAVKDLTVVEAVGVLELCKAPYIGRILEALNEAKVARESVYVPPVDERVDVI